MYKIKTKYKTDNLMSLSELLDSIKNINVSDIPTNKTNFDLLNQIEQLSTCESKLINKIKNLNYLENNENHHILNQKNIVPSNRVSLNKICSLMINWSNKFVVIALLTISAIALSKQAWA